MQDREKELQDKIKELQEQNKELQEQIDVLEVDSDMLEEAYNMLQTAREERKRLEISIKHERKKLDEREETLRKVIFELESTLDSRKWMRLKRTFGVLSVALYFIAFISQTMNSIEDYLFGLIGVLVAAGLLIFLSMMIVLHISAGALADAELIASRKSELNAIIDFKTKLK